MKPALTIAIIFIILGGGVLWYVSAQPDAPSANDANANTPARNTVANTNSDVSAEPEIKAFSTIVVDGLDATINFSAQIPADWEAEAVSGSAALNLYDPEAAGGSTLDQSQIFIKYFRASNFLTLSTVAIKSQTEANINGRPAVTYVIEKKSNVADFPSQPSWRNAEHRVTDIRSTDESPTTFYVFAKAPGVSDEVFDAFLESIEFSVTAAVYPMDDFPERITKKHFGQYITPTNSPVQPERFSGYHTAVDLETTEMEQNTDVPVYAIADGTIKVARTASGYGGVVLIEHSVGDETVTAVYSHVRLSSVAKSVGETVTQGERIAYLGTGLSSETDGERMHLHFGILKGASTNLKGYVSGEAGLSSWHDPEKWFE